MMKQLIVLAAAGLSLFTLSAHSQAFPTAIKPGGALRVGAEFSNANSDELPKRIGGISAYATYDLPWHLGVEADIHLLDYETPQDFGERTYLAGLRYSRRIHRFEPYIKVLGGIGQTVKESVYLGFAPNTPGTFSAFAIGGGTDYHFSHKWSLRGDFEQQLWPNFTPNSLTPTVLSGGISYRIR